MLCTLLLPKNTTASKLFKPLNDYFAEKLNWSFCVGVCVDEAAAMTVQIKEVAPECEAIIVSFTGKCWRAEKYHLRLIM